MVYLSGWCGKTTGDALGARDGNAIRGTGRWVHGGRAGRYGAGEGRRLGVPASPGDLLLANRDFVRPLLHLGHSLPDEDDQPRLLARDARTTAAFPRQRMFLKRTEVARDDVGGGVNANVLLWLADRAPRR